MIPAQRWDLTSTYARRGLVSVAAAAVNQVCLDARGGGAQLARCTARASQVALVAQQRIRITGRCLDAQGTTALLTACAGVASQQWTAGPDGELVNAARGRCLTDPHNSIAAGTRLRLAGCTGAAGQVWRLP